MIKCFVSLLVYFCNEFLQVKRDAGVLVMVVSSANCSNSVLDVEVWSLLGYML